MKVMRRGVGEGMLRRIYICGEFLDRLFCRRELLAIVSNRSLEWSYRRYTDVISILRGRMSALDSD